MNDRVTFQFDEIVQACHSAVLAERYTEISISHCKDVTKKFFFKPGNDFVDSQCYVKGDILRKIARGLISGLTDKDGKSLSLLNCSNRTFEASHFPILELLFFEVTYFFEVTNFRTGQFYMTYSTHFRRSDRDIVEQSTLKYLFV